jgi:2-dehydro-3-deoxyglucarate aldolase
MVQIENIQGVEQIEQILKYEGIDGVMIGPMDLSGSLGVPGEVEHPDVLEASNRVIEACERFSVSCGTQLSDPTPESVERLFARGFTYAILGSDLFALSNWSRSMNQLMSNVRGEK